MNSKFQNRKSTIENRQSKICRVVVIASSAGGIAALTEILSTLPADLPASVLIVQHLRSNRETLLPELLARVSRLPVCMAKEGVPLEAGAVFIARPGSHLSIKKNALHISLEEPENYVRPSADVLFSSAAQALGPLVIGVVLSGTGRDGALGCQEIKAKGGVTICQDEKTSRYFAMPRAAVDMEAIDYVLPLKEIAGKIVEILEIEDLSIQKGR